MTLDQFMAWENEQPERHEFHRGEWFNMVGGTRGHNRVIADLTRHLGNHLDNGPCQVFSEAMKVQVGNDSILYPDVLVTCDKQFQADELVVTAPTLIMEVLSPSTQRYDRRGGVLKLASIDCELPLEWVFKGMESESQ